MRSTSTSTATLICGISPLTQALDLQPGQGGTGAELTLAYLGKEGHERAAASFVDTLTSLGQSPSRIAPFRRTYETMGMTGALVEWLELFRGQDSLPQGAAVHAEFLAWCGEKDLAFKRLERAVQQQDPYVQAVETRHAYDSLRDDPRYADVLKHIRAWTKNVNAQSKP